MRKLGAAVVASVIAGLTLLFVAPTSAQTSPPTSAAKPAPPPSEARAKAVSASTVKQIVERSKKGFDLPFVLCKDINADLPAWRVAAGKNDPNGLVILGLCNYYGIGGKQNRDRGFDLIKAAADKGVPDAMAVFGILLRNGDMDHAPQLDQSLKYLQQAADEANELASNQLVLVRSDFLRMTGQFEAAIELLTGAAADGNLNAMYRLGRLKLEGWIQKLDREGGVALLQAAANGGHVAAMHELSIIYTIGNYAEPNERLAEQLVNAAAMTGYIPAVYAASGQSESGATFRQPTAREIAFFKQLEVSPDPQAALRLSFYYGSRVLPGQKDFDEKVADRAIDAAKRGVPEAYSFAARIFRNGTPKYPKDLAKAKAILEAGMKALDPDSTHEMALAARHGWFEPANEEVAMGRFQSAAAVGKAAAMAIVGDAFRDGRGLPRDLDQAHRAYACGSFAGDSDAMFGLARLYAFGEGTEAKPDDAAFWAKRAFAHGNGDGYFILAEMCRLGVGRTANLAEGIPLLMEGTKAGGMKCATRMGEMLIAGTAVPRDVPAGLSILERLIAHDTDGTVRFTLARYYRGGGPVPPNPDRARELAQQAADLGNSNGWAMLGYMKATEGTGEQSWGEAVDCYSKAIALGNGDAMLALGMHYLEGKVTQRDPERAVELWSDAVDQGNGEAALFLAQLKFGQFTPDVENEEEAIKWTGKAIELKRPDVCAYAAAFYNKRSDYISARQWLLRGIELGQVACYNDLGVLYRYGRGVDQSDTEAANCYRKGSDAGNMTATANLAALYEEGRGVIQDHAESMKLAQLAADNGEPIAMLFIGRKYIDGIGVEKDFKKGMEWVQKSANAGNELAKNMIAGAREKGMIP